MTDCVTPPQIEFVGGAVFSCAWAAGISNCTRIAPKGMQATVQAIYQVLSWP